MKTLIVVPRFAHSADDPRRFYLPVGLAYISSALKSSGYDVDAMNMNFYDESIGNIIQKMSLGKKYSMMLTGGLSTHYAAVKKVVDSFHMHAPSTEIILGGGLVSSTPSLMFNALKPDYMVIGEGEQTIVELCRCIDRHENLSAVNGIAYKRNSDVVYTGQRKPIENIDSIAWPDYEGMGFESILNQLKPTTSWDFDVFDNPRPYPIVASRSCPFLCTFCYHPIGNKYRQRSISSIMDETSFAITKYKINIISFYDELFSNKKEWVLEFCAQLKHIFKSVPWEIKWSCQMRVDTIDAELIEAMKDSGCYYISLGLESYSNEVLKSMRKKITSQQIDNALQIIHKYSIGITGNFIFGDVEETPKTISETINFWKRNYHGILKGSVALGFIQPYPGTALYKHMIDNHIVTDEIDFIENHLLEPINLSSKLSHTQFQKLKEDVSTLILSYPKMVQPYRILKNIGLREIHVKCPYCGVVSIYKNYSLPGIKTYNTKNICCRNCRMRFQIVSLSSKIYNLLLRLVGPKSMMLLNPLKYFIRNYIQRGIDRKIHGFSVKKYPS